VKTACYCISLRRASNALTRLYDEVLRPCGLKVTQYTLLKTLERVGSADMGRLSSETYLDPTTLTRNLKPLEISGYVKYEPASDARRRIIRLTEDGHRIIREAQPLWKEAQKKVEDKLGGHLNPELFKTLQLMLEIEPTLVENS
jgi:DNA-binding MarR family transcriptional regulator